MIFLFVDDLGVNTSYQGVPKHQRRKTSSQWRHMRNRENINSQCFIYGHNFKNIYFWLSGGCGAFNDQNGSILFPIYPLTHINVHVKIGSNWVILNQKYEAIFFYFRGSLWALTSSIQGYQNISGQEDLITELTYVWQGKIWSSGFHIWTTMWKICTWHFFFNLRGPGEP